MERECEPNNVLTCGAMLKLIQFGTIKPLLTIIVTRDEKESITLSNVKPWTKKQGGGGKKE